MELSSAAQKGLQAAGSSVISDQVFQDLARQAVQDSIAPADANDLKSKLQHNYSVFILQLDH